MYGLKTESSFDAAHFLTNYDGKCENLHGHRWRVIAWIEVEHLQEGGQELDMVVDFSDFKHALRSLTEELDHMFIVEDGSLAPETVAALLPLVRSPLAHYEREFCTLLLRPAFRDGLSRGKGRSRRNAQ